MGPAFGSALRDASIVVLALDVIVEVSSVRESAQHPLINVPRNVVIPVHAPAVERSSEDGFLVAEALDAA